MLRYIIALIGFLPIVAKSQQIDWKKLQKNSAETFVYKITAAQAEQFIKWDSIPVDIFLSEIPVKIFKTDSVQKDSLAIGQYVLLSIKDNEIEARMFANTHLFIYPVINEQVHIIEVRDVDGNYINNALVWVDSKKAKVLKNSGNYQLKQKKLPKKSFIKVYAENDTAFLGFEKDDRYYYRNNTSVLKQKINYWKNKPLIRNIIRIPLKYSNGLMYLATKKYKYQRNYKYTYGKRGKYKSGSIGANGYMVFNQPKYKLTDTVKLKAYIIDKKEKQYNKPVAVYLSYYARNKYNNQFLTILHPNSKGSYVFEFPLHDSLYNDVTYSLLIKTKDSKKQILTSSFKTEDYVLDEVATYNFRSEKPTYYKQDSLVFYASAKDANNLPLLDAKAKFYLLPQSVKSYQADSIYIPDTLFFQQKKLEAEGDTKFSIAAKDLPKASLSLKAKIEFINSNNEIQEKYVSVNYEETNKEIRAKIVADTVYAEYFEDGISKKAFGELDVENDKGFENTLKITYPYKGKIEPLTESYDFSVYEKDSLVAFESIEQNASTAIDFNRISKHDTAGFELINPLKIPINYLIFDGNKLVESVKSSEEKIIWLKKISNRKKTFTLKYNYAWQGKQMEKKETIALLYKLLNIEIKGKDKVFPGQKDSLTVEVKDYKGYAVNNMNLTAVSYNTQFKKDITVKEPPYLAKYKKTTPLWRRGKFKDDEAKDVYISKKYLLGKHQQWRNKLGVDSMLYYQMLFPDSNGMQIATAKKEFIPEVTIYVVKNGKPEPIYILYLNNQPVYYDITTVKMPYSFYVANSYTKIGFRLLDKYVEIDSFYLQPYYRHKLVFDLDKLPANAKTIAKNDYYDSDESNLIERTTWQLNKNFSNAYVWQNWKVAEIKTSSRSNSYSKHLIGPFYANDSMHYFQRNQFDIHFRFEYGYEYSLSDKILRLEKKNILETTTKSFTTPSYRYYINENRNYYWNNLSDTVASSPIIEYTKPKEQPFIYLSNFKKENLFITDSTKEATIIYSTKGDSVIKYIVFIHKKSGTPFVTDFVNYSHALGDGEYEMLLITNHWNVAKQNIRIKQQTTLYIKTEKWKFEYNRQLIDSIRLISSRNTIIVPVKQNETNTNRNTTANTSTYIPVMEFSNAQVNQKIIITDDIGEAIPFASIINKKTGKGISADINGIAIFNNLPIGKNVLVISAIGMERKEVTLTVYEGIINNRPLNVLLQRNLRSHDEAIVVTTALGEIREAKELGYSTLKISAKELSTEKSLTGKVSGLVVIGYGNSSNSLADTRITLRGIRSITGNNQPILIVDGIISDISLINTINPNDIESTEVLKGEDATAIYGIKAIEGAIIIKTKNPLTLRTKFRDYAFWKPELFTNKQGKVSFEVTYPDNITSWETYVLGMDKKRRIGKAVTITRAFKPVMAQLSLPQFLIEGDEVNIVGKVLNYTQDVYQYKSTFSIQNNIVKQTSATVNSSASLIEKLQVKTPFADTLKAKFSIETTTGFKDGEERKIPIFKKGIEETIGNFWVLNNDTTINYTASNDANSIEINAVVNTLDILLKEIDHLKNYPYYCMEQTSSKLKGLLLEKQIREQLHQPFKADKDINFLINKLQKAQNFDGSWGWWEGGKANIHITNYVLNSLLLVPQNELIKTNIRNGLLYLENQLPRLNKDELLSTLVTMNNAKHSFDYTNYINKIDFDSISLNQQWQYVRIKQQLKKDYTKELDSLMKKANNGILGSLSWGTQNYLWYNNHTASTLIAYEVFSNDEKYRKYLPSIMQYFIAERRNGYWTNTVESSSILATILPDVLANNKNFNQKPLLEIDGDTSFTVNNFPFNKKLSSNIHQLSFTKKSGGLMYLTAFQKKWNTNPNIVDDKFKIKTYFSKNGEHTAYLEAGGKVTMTVAVEVLKDAEYVMIEVPIPAGCLYGSKKNNYYEYREYSKNKVSVFVEKMNTGTHYFTIELEPRYTGTFTLNAAKAELMYFPTFYGRNETKQVEIKE